MDKQYLVLHAIGYFCKDRYIYVCHNMDEHSIYYAELVKPAIDKTTSKEKFNLVDLMIHFQINLMDHGGYLYLCKL